MTGASLAREGEASTSSWPKRIYLQRHDDCVADNCGPHGEDTTWCSDKINEHDVEYIRADLVSHDA